MCQLLTLLNRLKVSACRDFLTDSQLEALSNILELWRFPGRINLWGPPGSGKTMLGWVVAREMQVPFYASPRVLGETTALDLTHVIVDNSPHQSGSLRALLTTLQLMGMGNALLVTEEPNRLGFPAVAVPAPTPHDVDVVYRNLSLLDFYPPRPQYSENLWTVLRSAL